MGTFSPLYVDRLRDEREVYISKAKGCRIYRPPHQFGRLITQIRGET